MSRLRVRRMVSHTMTEAGDKINRGVFSASKSCNGPMKFGEIEPGLGIFKTEIELLENPNHELAQAFPHGRGPANLDARGRIPIFCS